MAIQQDVAADLLVPPKSVEARSIKEEGITGIVAEIAVIGENCKWTEILSTRLDEKISAGTLALPETTKILAALSETSAGASAEDTPSKVDEKVQGSLCIDSIPGVDDLEAMMSDSDQLEDFQNTFKKAVADSLDGVDESDVRVLGVDRGSIIVNYEISTENAMSLKDAIDKQVEDESSLLRKQFNVDPKRSTSQAVAEIDNIAGPPEVMPGPEDESSGKSNSLPQAMIQFSEAAVLLACLITSIM
jgi:hypothetical protein